MKKGSGAFKESYHGGESKRKREAVILPFKQKLESKGEEKRQDYAGYKTLGGVLSQEEYQNVRSHAADKEYIPSGSLWRGHANFMASTAGITLSPETVTIYEILRSEKPDPAKEHYSELGDQKLLAEALRIVGDKNSLDMFIEKLPHIFN